LNEQDGISIGSAANRVASPNTNNGGQTISIVSPSHAAVTGSSPETGFVRRKIEGSGPAFHLDHAGGPEDPTKP
jgi:hypothetical protein